MYIDSKLRVQGSNGMYGQLAVKLNGDKVVETKIIWNDEMLSPDYDADNMLKKIESKFEGK